MIKKRKKESYDNLVCYRIKKCGVCICEPMYDTSVIVLGESENEARERQAKLRRIMMMKCPMLNKQRNDKIEMR